MVESFGRWRKGCSLCFPFSLFPFVPNDVQGSHTPSFAHSALLKRRISLCLRDLSAEAQSAPFAIDHVVHITLRNIKRDLNRFIKSVRRDSEHCICRDPENFNYLIAELTYTPRASNCLGGIVGGIVRRRPEL